MSVVFVEAVRFLWWVPLLFPGSVALAVLAGVLYGAWTRAREPIDPEYASVFDGVRASLWRCAWGLIVEIWYQAWALLLRMLHAWRLLPSPALGDTASAPVLVLPGYTENAGTMWWLGRKLARAGFHPILLDFPSTLHRIEDNVEFLRIRIAELRAQLNAPAIPVVAHSMGGLITRTLIHTHADHGVLTLVAIASPFRGTRLAQVGMRLGLRGHCLGQMIPGSEFLRRYPPSLPCKVPILSMIACQENIVVPEWSAVVADAEVRVLSQPWGHQAPLFVDEVSTQVERWLLRYGVIRANIVSMA